jgi:hypothetical protein
MLRRELFSSDHFGLYCHSKTGPSGGPYCRELEVTGFRHGRLTSADRLNGVQDRVLIMFDVAEYDGNRWGEVRDNVFKFDKTSTGWSFSGTGEYSDME